MSQLTTLLGTRIEDLITSIEAQTAELAAYERVLHLELAKGSTPAEGSLSETHHRPASVLAPVTPKFDSTNVEFTGNKTALAAEIVNRYGSVGASSREVDQVFTARKIKRSRKFVTKTLSYLAAQKRLELRNGRYYGVRGQTVMNSGGAAPSVAPAKKKMSAAAIKKIREGVRKYWASKKAAAK